MAGLRRVLVTGGTGFIGSHLVERLLADGYEVRLLARTNARQSLGWLDEADPPVTGRIEIVWGDVRDPAAIEAALAECDAVCHLAALISIPYSYERPGEVMETNAVGTMRLAHAAARAGVRLFLHTSTSETYGSAQRIPMDETHPIHPQSPYAAAKAAGDLAVDAAARTWGLRSVTLRPFNNFGPRQSPRAIIPLLCAQALWADEIHVGSLAPRRDFLYAGDTAAAYARLLGMDEPPLGETFNLGNGASITIGELLERVCAAAKRKIPVRQEAARIRPAGSEVSHLECDARRFGARCGWKPAVSLDEGIARTMTWMRARPELFRTARQAL